MNSIPFRLGRIFVNSFEKRNDRFSSFFVSKSYSHLKFFSSTNVCLDFKNLNNKETNGYKFRILLWISIFFIFLPFHFQRFKCHARNFLWSLTFPIFSRLNCQKSKVLSVSKSFKSPATFKDTPPFRYFSTRCEKLFHLT